MNRQRSYMQKFIEQNHKLSQNNGFLRSQLNNHEGTIKALEEKIELGEKEIAKYKEQQLCLIENKKCLRAELMEYKQRCAEVMIQSEEEKLEMQQIVTKLQGELEQRDARCVELENKLDAIRTELQNKIDECGKSNEERSLLQSEIDANKQQIQQLEQTISTLKADLAEKDEVNDKLRKEHDAYKIETEKTINKMQEVQRIFYPNAANPLPKSTHNSELRSTLPASNPVLPRPQNMSTLKRSNASTSSDSETEPEHQLLLRGWVPPRDFEDNESRVGFESRSTDIPATPEKVQQPRRKRYRRMN